MNIESEFYREYISNLFTLDVLEEARYLKSDSAYLKVYWNAFAVHRYKFNKFVFSSDEICRLSQCCLYRDLPLPRYVSVVAQIYGDQFYEDAYLASPFCGFGFDLFLLDFTLYLSYQLFDCSSFPKEFLDWALSSNCENLEVSVPIPRLGMACHIASKEVSNKFDLKKLEGRLGLLGWTLKWKMRSLKGAIICKELSSWLGLPALLSPFSLEAGITRMHEAIYFESPSEFSTMKMDFVEGALEFSVWMLIEGPNIPGFELPEWLLALLDINSNAFVLSEANKLTRAIWHYEKGPVDFPSENSSELSDFFGSYNEKLSFIIKRWGIKKQFKIANNNFSEILSQGVNLIGWPRTEIGIGEDVRCAAFSLDSVGFPFVVVDAALRVPPRPRQVDGSVSKWISSYKYPVDIIFLDAATQFRYYAHELMSKPFLDRKVIGVCPWELPRWPEELGFVFDHMSVFWAATEFIKDAFSQYFPGRIDIARPAVVLPPESYKVPDLSCRDKFKFITIFDGLSSIHRKNPFAVVNAFKMAFPVTSDVGLIIKMMNLPASCKEAFELNELIAGDQRIQVITETLPQSKLWALVSSCHVFVSLHRSEGFGRNIAEAMALGRPVICSNFSGNRDFCNNENSFLVEGDVVPVLPGQYLNFKDQNWFDASVEHAAQCMNFAFGDYSGALVRANRGRDHILQNHSYDAVGKQYVRLLNECFV